MLLCQIVLHLKIFLTTSMPLREILRHLLRLLQYCGAKLFQNSIFISPYVFRLYKAWIKGLSCGGTKRSACKKPCLISRICIFCYAKKKIKQPAPWRRKRFIVFCAFFESKNMRKYFYFPEYKTSSGFEKYKLCRYKKF